MNSELFIICTIIIQLINLFTFALGGHTSEMLQLLRGIDKNKFSPRVYAITLTDTISHQRCIKAEDRRADIIFEQLPRSRGFLSLIFSVINSFSYWGNGIYL